MTSPSEELTDLILKLNEAFRYMDAQIAAGKRKSGGEEEPTTATPETTPTEPGTVDAGDVE